MPMPEAAVNEDDPFPARKNQVRAPRDRANMQPKSVSHCMNKLPHEQFWLGIAPRDGGHASTPLLWCQNVHMGILVPIGDSDNKQRMRSGDFPSL
jgi:hypothetical protein